MWILTAIGWAWKAIKLSPLIGGAAVVADQSLYGGKGTAYVGGMAAHKGREDGTLTDIQRRAALHKGVVDTHGPWVALIAEPLAAALLLEKPKVDKPPAPAVGVVPASYFPDTPAADTGADGGILNTISSTVSSAARTGGPFAIAAGLAYGAWRLTKSVFWTGVTALGAFFVARRFIPDVAKEPAPTSSPPPQSPPSSGAGVVRVAQRENAPAAAPLSNTPAVGTAFTASGAGTVRVPAATTQDLTGFFRKAQPNAILDAANGKVTLIKSDAAPSESHPAPALEGTG